ncbi:MAG: P-II family nitrogen regulator [Spirochaetes bacterium]|nr:P-II family nitrogen regulator [Spirochaetota bacterium]MBN2771904.1 P-II family nitrogen regulator [Spirochaetota bacterium]
MKEVMAVIRMNKINETKRALSKAGISSFTATGKVLGRGKGLVDFSLLEGAKAGYQEAIAQLGQGPRLISKRLLTVVVPDNKVNVTVKTIIQTNQTGKSGDGKIFVLPVIDAFKIRTKENGDPVLDND